MLQAFRGIEENYIHFLILDLEAMNAKKLNNNILPYFRFVEHFLPHSLAIFYLSIAKQMADKLMKVDPHKQAISQSHTGLPTDRIHWISVFLP